MAGVELIGVEKVFPGGARALSALDLAVADGELLVLVGPSGCGKSTLLRLVAGLEEPTRGEIRIGGRRANDLAPQARNVAMVFQDYALYPTMTVRANLGFPLRMRGLRGAELERRVAGIAELLGIGSLLDRPPRQLSGGQRQRVAMGRALVREPAVFLLDEPLSNLDARLRVEMRDEIAEIQRRTKTTMLYVTHDQVEAMTLGQRVAVLDQGHLQQVAPPRALYERPANRFVASFVGSPPMNLFPARVVPAADGSWALLLAGVSLPFQPDTALAAALRDAGERRVQAGVRPEDLHVTERDGFPVRVRHVELLGHETLVHVTHEGGEGPVLELVARLPGMRPLARGDALRLAPDPHRVHVFDDRGVALGRGD